jgi:hypothetical protein
MAIAIVLSHRAFVWPINQRRIVMQQHLTYMRRKAAAGWAFLVWLFGGGLGLAIVVFIVLKMMGH